MSTLKRIVLKSPSQRNSLGVKWTSGGRDIINSLLEYYGVVFINLARGRATIKLLAVKTVFVRNVFAVQLGLKLLKLSLCSVLRLRLGLATSCLNRCLVLYVFVAVNGCKFGNQCFGI